MPIYEYECTSCGHRFEKMVKMGADAPPCPACESAVRKLVSRSGFILQGGGWYKDHYGLKNGGGSSSESSSKGATTPSTPSPTKSDTSTSSSSASTPATATTSTTVAAK